MKKILRWLGEWLLRSTYEPIRLDSVNKKLIRPVENLVIDGVQYYEFVNVADMPDSRYVHYLNFVRELNMGMDRETVNEYLTELIKANDANERSRIGSLLYMWQDSLNNCTPMEAMYNIAALVYFDKDEDLKTWDNDYNQAKIAGFKKLKDQGFFFARLFEQTLNRPGLGSPDDIAKYLKESGVKLQAYARIRSGLSE